MTENAKWIWAVIVGIVLALMVNGALVYMAVKIIKWAW